ncbi:MAG: flippase-like domain-containing protein [Acidobacteriaceae bacterium]|nr:flippase-like domain-containing protein [Acidobacteriaceae bacterium]
MKKRSGWLWLCLAAVVTILVVVFRGRIHFDFASFWQQLKDVSMAHVAAALALNLATYWLRAARWSVFVRPAKKVSAAALVAPQFIGFTAVALFGRLADLARPYVVARKIELSLSSQIAVYTLERMFDLGASAVILSTALAFVPRSFPHHEAFVRTGLGGLAVAAAIAILAALVRASGGMVAEFARSGLGLVSKSAAQSVAEKILGFRDGLNTLETWRDFAGVTALSLVMWGMIAAAYVEVLRAFQQTPELAAVSFSSAMLLMAANQGGSLVQLPIVGWFTQIGVAATAVHEFYGAPVETATACGTVLLAVTFLCIIPIGLVLARLERVSLKKVATESETAKTVA